MPQKKPRRIPLGEALDELDPLMSRSKFYGQKSAGKPGPRWTMVEQLQIRSGRNGLTLDRRRFERWLKTLQGELAHDAHPNSARFGKHAASSGQERSYGEQLAHLCHALESEAISRQQFDRAVASLEAGAASRGSVEK